MFFETTTTSRACGYSMIHENVHVRIALTAQSIFPLEVVVSSHILGEVGNFYTV